MTRGDPEPPRKVGGVGRGSAFTNVPDKNVPGIVCFRHVPGTLQKSINHRCVSVIYLFSKCGKTKSGKMF